MYKLVVMDVDDTIVMLDKKVTSVVKEAIKKAQEKGIKVTLASGRMHQAMQSVAKELEIKLPLISCNGALVRDDKNVISCDLLDKEVAKDVMSFLMKRNVYCKCILKRGSLQSKNVIARGDLSRVKVCRAILLMRVHIICFTKRTC